FVLMVVIGGSGSVAGVAVGTAVLNWILESASTSQTAAVWPIVFGLALMLTLIIAPGGLAGLVSGLLRRVRGDSAPDRGEEPVDPSVAEAALVPDTSGSRAPSTTLAVAG